MERGRKKGRKKARKEGRKEGGREGMTEGGKEGHMHKDLGERRKERGKETKGRRKKGGETWQRKCLSKCLLFPLERRKHSTCGTNSKFGKSSKHFMKRTKDDTDQ